MYSCAPLVCKWTDVILRKRADLLPLPEGKGLCFPAQPGGGGYDWGARRLLIGEDSRTHASRARGWSAQVPRIMSRGLDSAQRAASLCRTEQN